jgi:hypothetical protein
VASSLGRPSPAPPGQTTGGSSSSALTSRPRTSNSVRSRLDAPEAHVRDNIRTGSFSRSGDRSQGLKKSVSRFSRRFDFPRVFPTTRRVRNSYDMQQYVRLFRQAALCSCASVFPYFAKGSARYNACRKRCSLGTLFRRRRRRLVRRRYSVQSDRIVDLRMNGGEVDMAITYCDDD